MDRHPGPHRRRPLPGDGAHRVRRARCGEAAGSDRRHRRRAPVVVGDPLPRARHRHRQRAARTRERSRRADADVPRARIRRRRAQLLGATPGRQDRFDTESHEPDVDRAARAWTFSRAMRRILRHPARAYAAAGLRAHARRIRTVDRGAASARRRRSCRRSRTAALRDDRVHQLPRRARHGGNGPLRAGPHPPDEPRDTRRRRCADDARGAARVDRRPR